MVPHCTGKGKSRLAAQLNYGKKKLIRGHRTSFYIFAGVQKAGCLSLPVRQSEVKFWEVLLSFKLCMGTTFSKNSSMNWQTTEVSLHVPLLPSLLFVLDPDVHLSPVNKEDTSKVNWCFCIILMQIPWWQGPGKVLSVSHVAWFCQKRTFSLSLTKHLLMFNANYVVCPKDWSVDSHSY